MIIQFASTMRRLRRDESGVTVIEFGFVAPVLCLLLMGMFDLGFQAYAQTNLSGAMQEAARKSALEPTTITTNQLDAEVTEAIQAVVPSANVTFTRKNYETFDDIDKPEDFTDNNGNGICDNNEPFEDLNGNLNWDQDRGRNGLGGARDAVLYTASASFDRVFPLYGFIDIPSTATISASTVLRNQPYDEQTDRQPVVGYCT